MLLVLLLLLLLLPPDRLHSWPAAGHSAAATPASAPLPSHETDSKYSHTLMSLARHESEHAHLQEDVEVEDEEEEVVQEEHLEMGNVN